MTKLIASIAASTLILILTGVWTAIRQPGKDEKALVVVSEIPETSLMGAMLVAISYFLLIAKINDPSVAGTDETSYNFVALFAFVCAVSGCFIILMTLVKKVIAYPDKFAVMNWIGKKKEFSWGSVTEVKSIPLSLRVTFKMKDQSVSVNGRAKEYGEFVRIAREKVPAIVGSEVLDHLYKKITNQGLIKLGK